MVDMAHIQITAIHNFEDEVYEVTISLTHSAKLHGRRLDQQAYIDVSAGDSKHVVDKLIKPIARFFRQ